MFRKFWLDVILATAFIFGLMGLFSQFTAFKIFDVFDPIGEAFADMEVTDIVFSQLIDDPVADDRIVLVNLSTLQRAEIGLMLQIISKYDPAVVGIDSFFYTPKDDTLGDMMLAEGMASVENLVLASKLILDETDVTRDSIAYSWELFNGLAEEKAFVNLITDAKIQEGLKMCRTFLPKYNYQGEEQEAFAVKLASYLDPGAAKRFLERNNEVEVINYKGNIPDYSGSNRFGNKFFALDVQDVFQENFTPDMIKDKIVMFCFLGEYLGDPESIEDKFYTPLNEKYIGRAFPDMYGGVVHANIVSMILNEDYINVMTETQGVVLAVILCFLNVALFSMIYRKLPHWYDGITKLFQLIEIAVLTFAMIYILEGLSYKMELGLAIFAVALAGDSLEVYYGVVKNSLTKEGRKSLIKVNKL